MMGKDINWTRYWVITPYVVSLVFLYGYLLWVFDPHLMLHIQSPAFFLDGSRCLQVVRSVPGGFVALCAAGLTQLFAREWVGALTLTLGIGLIWLLAEGLNSTFSRGKRVWWLAFLPVIPLLILLSRYTLALGSLLALAMGIVSVLVYVMLPLQNRAARLCVGVVLCAGVYVVAGTIGCLCAVLYALSEWRLRRSGATAVILVAIGTIVPYLVGTYLYRISPQASYLQLIALRHDISPPLPSIALYVSVLLVAVIAALGRVPANPERGAIASVTEKRPWWCLRTFILVLVGGTTAWLSFDRQRASVIAVDYHVRNRQWQAALDAAKPLSLANGVPTHGLEKRLSATYFGYGYSIDAWLPAPLWPTLNAAIHDINFALAKKGQLLDSMFCYPQRMGSSVVRLLPDDEGYYVTHSFNCDVLLELGDVNEAERVLCESLANVGPRAWLLRRLTTINVLKDRPQAARICINLLAEHPGQRAWAESMRRELDKDPSMAEVPFVRQCRQCMYRVDRVGHLGNMNPDEELLRYLLTDNPKNRLAFDYLTAHYLLTHQYAKVADNMRYLATFGYTRMPRHCEEALVLLAQFDGNDRRLHGLSIRPETIRRFESFQRDLDALGGPSGSDRVKTRDALLSYADTYWFYALFGDTFSVSPQQSASIRPGEGS